MFSSVATGFGSNTFESMDDGKVSKTHLYLKYICSWRFISLRFASENRGKTEMVFASSEMDDLVSFYLCNSCRF